MTTLAVDGGHFTARHVRALVRQPYFLVITLVQPVIWLLLFGQLFKRVVEIPGFSGGTYIDFLTPGVVVMTVLFSSGWAGMAFIENGIILDFRAPHGIRLGPSPLSTGFEELWTALDRMRVLAAAT